jgi:tetratricopeptide (TPR) repeat protein
LFDATTQKITLSEKHDFNLESVFDVQDEIARRIVESLQRRFPSDVPRSRDRYSSDPEAYHEFMAGLRESSSDEADRLRSAAEHLSKAIQRDPDFALARAMLSFVSTNLHFHFDTQHAWLQQAEDQCRRALALDATLPEAHLARSWILWSPAKNFQHADAIAALEQVLIARPNFERAHRMSSICWHIGRLEEARIAHEYAQRINPETRSGNLEWYYLMSGDFAAAENATAAWLRDRPGNLYARVSHVLPPLFSGNLALAEERLTPLSTQLPDEPLIFGLQGILHAKRLRADLAVESVRKALECPRSFGHTHHTYHYIAGVYAVLGEIDKAMAWLERSVDTGWACWPFFRIDPHFENLRDEPRFKALMADLEQTYTALEIRRL